MPKRAYPWGRGYSHQLKTHISPMEVACGVDGQVYKDNIYGYTKSLMSKGAKSFYSSNKENQPERNQLLLPVVNEGPQKTITSFFGKSSKSFSNGFKSNLAQKTPLVSNASKQQQAGAAVIRHCHGVRCISNTSRCTFCEKGVCDKCQLVCRNCMHQFCCVCSTICYDSAEEYAICLSCKEWFDAIGYNLRTHSIHLSNCPFSIRLSTVSWPSTSPKKIMITTAVYMTCVVGKYFSLSLFCLRCYIVVSFNYFFAFSIRLLALPLFCTFFFVIDLDFLFALRLLVCATVRACVDIDFCISFILGINHVKWTQAYVVSNLFFVSQD